MKKIQCFLLGMALLYSLPASAVQWPFGNVGIEVTNYTSSSIYYEVSLGGCKVSPDKASSGTLASDSSSSSSVSAYNATCNQKASEMKCQIDLYAADGADPNNYIGFAKIKAADKDLEHKVNTSNCTGTGCNYSLDHTQAAQNPEDPFCNNSGKAGEAALMKVSISH